MADQQSRHAFVLATLARGNDAEIKQFAEQLLADIDEVEVIKNRTGLVMLPMRDTVEGTAFHLGEVLVAEAHIRALGQEGYGMKTGRDLEAAMAIAVIDAAWQAGHELSTIDAFVAAQADAIAANDNERMRAVEATRVNMETF
ncbi:alpha-D-ribose 1-methylphosphonate 5-triphosphate synthase subunit PhnG [Maritalea mobilis]|uniref:Alpha-D-ribose 1-methylphosphonate 5-triphosphate synthase subunit PhnG n=1 Tax=Maritalea mobilis TaxID=483324 RepID=A0A4R6VSY2_9HYPH|nr:phosphonate C-P lyase system protein PhnG [Maritalea mobilis]TDQ67192.1 alpha-D-ribose 1-methylphosphonate 5-triphosphate synthase subunit PhnG [Maritalea mobilis]